MNNEREPCGGNWLHMWPTFRRKNHSVHRWHCCWRVGVSTYGVTLPAAIWSDLVVLVGGKTADDDDVVMNYLVTAWKLFQYMQFQLGATIWMFSVELSHSYRRSWCKHTRTHPGAVLIIRCRNDFDYEAVKVEFWWRLGDTYAKWAFPGVLVVVVGMAGSNIKQGEAQWDEDETIPKTNKTLLQTSDFDMTCEMVVLALSNCCWAAVRGNW